MEVRVLGCSGSRVPGQLTSCLLLDGKITNVMATSLINDSEQASKIIRNLVDIATLLYYPRDRLVSDLEEKQEAA